MHKVILIWLTILGVWFGTAPAQAVNSAERLDTLPVTISGVPYDVSLYRVVVDTVSTPLTIESALSADHTVCEVGVFVVEAGAQTITFTPKAAKTIPLEFAANSGLYNRMDGGVGLCTARGSAFIIESNAAFTGYFYLLQAKRLKF